MFIQTAIRPIVHSVNWTVGQSSRRSIGQWVKWIFDQTVTRSFVSVGQMDIRSNGFSVKKNSLIRSGVQSSWRWNGSRWIGHSLKRDSLKRDSLKRSRDETVTGSNGSRSKGSRSFVQSVNRESVIRPGAICMVYNLKNVMSWCGLKAELWSSVFCQPHLSWNRVPRTLFYPSWGY